MSSADQLPSKPVAPLPPGWRTRIGLLEVRVEVTEDQWLLELDGELDASNVSVLERELRTAEASFPERMVVSLERLSFIDSSGVRAILTCDRRLRRKPTRLFLHPGPRAVQTAFRITGTEQQLRFEPPAPRTG